MLKIDFNAFLGTLPIMLKGMIGIFAVTGVTILSMFLLRKLSEAIARKKEK